MVIFAGIKLLWKQYDLMKKIYNKYVLIHSYPTVYGVREIRGSEFLLASLWFVFDVLLPRLTRSMQLECMHA